MNPQRIHPTFHRSSVSQGLIYDDRTPNYTKFGNFESVREDKGLSSISTVIINQNGVLQVIEVIADGIRRSSAELLGRIRTTKQVNAVLVWFASKGGAGWSASRLGVVVG